MIAGRLEYGLKHGSSYIIFQTFSMCGTSPVSNSSGEVGELFGLCALLTRDQMGPQMS